MSDDPKEVYARKDKILDDFAKISDAMGMLADNAKRKREQGTTSERIPHPNVERFKIMAIQKAMQEVLKRNTPITLRDVEVMDIGSGMKQKLSEYLKTGKISEYEKYLKDPKFQIFRDLINVKGIGSSRAMDLIYNRKIKHLNDLINMVNLRKISLPTEAIYGLRYYKDLNTPIPREQIKKIEKKLKKIIPKTKYTIAGSYRRERPYSNDIDIIIIIKNDKERKSYKEKLRKLFSGEIIKSGNERHVLYAKVGGKTREIDIRFCTQEEYPFMLLYYTGNQLFSINIRRYAKSLGYKLNQKGLYKYGKKVKGLKSEKDIFKKLKLEYIPPKERIN